MPLGPLILVVEDDENDLNWLKRTLSSAGYVVDSAANGAEAIAKARHTPYAAVLLDLILPTPWAGMCFTKYVKQKPMKMRRSLSLRW